MLARSAAARRHKYEAWVSCRNGATVRGSGAAGQASVERRPRPAHTLVEQPPPTLQVPTPDEARAAPNLNSTT
jgi:hypothetical protein